MNFLLWTSLALVLPLTAEAFVSLTPLSDGIGTQKPPANGRKRDRNRTNTAVDASLLSEAVGAYAFALDAYQTPTQILTGGLLSGVGDAVAQTRETTTTNDVGTAGIDYNDITRRWNARRTGLFAVKGLGGAVIWSFWYGTADEISASACQWVDCGGWEGTEAVLRTACSIALEQFVWCPIVYSIWDIPMPRLLSGAPLSSVPDDIQDKLGGLLVANAKVWTFINILIYNIPVEWRVVVSSLADLVWQSILSTMTMDDTASALEGEDKFPIRGTLKEPSFFLTKEIS